MTFAPFTFNVEAITSIHDGDTARFRLTRDCGFGIWVTPDPSMSCRLIGVAARELDDPDGGGPEARDHLAGLLGTDVSRLRVVSVKWDRNGGRYDGTIYADGLCVNDLMIRDGFALPWNGTGTQPRPEWPPVPRPDWAVRTGP